MRWETGRRSGNVIDQRGRRIGGPIALGGGASLIAALIYMLLGGDPSAFLNSNDNDNGSGQVAQVDPEEERLKEFVSVVLADTEDTWPALLEKEGLSYAQPQLVLFSDAVRSACGTQTSAVGPFYCPLDSRVYLDLEFFNELDRRFGAPGDFAQAYVVAHEIGHHVQNLLGISEEVHAAQQRTDRTSANQLSVLLELQADCFAGVWAHHAQKQRQVLEPGDVEEGLMAASAIGDDTLQKRARGHVVPESFTHGSSAQRVQWFRRGFEQGTVEGCNTFETAGNGRREAFGRRR